MQQGCWNCLPPGLVGVWQSGNLALWTPCNPALHILRPLTAWWRGSMSGVASPEGKMGWAATHDTREPLYFGVSDYPRLSYIAQRHHTIQDPCRR